MNSLFHIRHVDDSVVERSFRIALADFPIHLGVGNHCRPRHQRPQLLEKQVVFLQLFKPGRRQVGLLEQVFILLLSNKLPAGEEGLAILTVLELLMQFGVADPQTHIVRRH